MVRFLLIIVGILGCAGCESPPHQHHALRGSQGEVSVFVFTSVDCPIANAMAPQLQRTFEIARERGVRTYLVYPREGLTLDVITAHANDYQLDAVVVADPEKRLVIDLGATVTPEGVVVEHLAGDGYEIRYRGRLNDLYPSIGNRRDQVSSHDFRNAILAVRENRAVADPVVPAVGCMIERAP